LGSQSDKKPRLGLTDNEVSSLNDSVSEFFKTMTPAYDNFSVADLTSNHLAITIQQIAFNLLKSSHASSLDKRWLDHQAGAKRINELPHDEQGDLKSAWVEARNKGWENLAGHGALIPRSTHANIKPV
jgi:hypothetical protein